MNEYTKFIKRLERVLKTIPEDTELIAEGGNLVLRKRGSLDEHLVRDSGFGFDNDGLASTAEIPNFYSYGEGF